MKHQGPSKNLKFYYVLGVRCQNVLENKTRSAMNQTSVLIYLLPYFEQESESSVRILLSPLHTVSTFILLSIVKENDRILFQITHSGGRLWKKVA